MSNQTKQEYMNAKQVYAAYGITRSILGRLVEAGRVNCRVVTDDIASLKLYRVADIENVINGGSGHGN